MARKLVHPDLNTTFCGLDDDRFGPTVQHFRGIRYGRIPARFASPILVSVYEAHTPATEFGPVCPQLHVEVGHLLRLPPSDKQPELPQDEFECLNLNITRPQLSTDAKLLPVLVWIHGGSQVVSFASAASAICDPTRLVADSVHHHQPILIVTFNYRLNIFAFGNGCGTLNLALKDQSLLIQWVKRYIEGFGGDADNITLAGESAGAVYAHAQIVLEAPVRRIALASGSLYLSPPLPTSIGDSLIERLNNAVGTLSDLTDVPVKTLLEGLKQIKIHSMFLQQESALDRWKDAKIEIPMLVGDVEFEASMPHSILWRQGIEAMTPEQIASGFDAAGTSAATLKALYHMDPSRPAQARHSALDFINDARFALPVHVLCKPENNVAHNRFRYVFDEANPWQTSSRAHHAVDLLYLFGGYNFEESSAPEATGRAFRRKWIDFINGEQPWTSEGTYAFGPHGQSRLLGQQELSFRRRTQKIEKLLSLGFDCYNPAFAALASGRISLLN